MQTAPLTASESEWVGLQLSTAALLAKAYTGDTEDLPRLDQLDATWLAWQDDVRTTRPDANVVVNASESHSASTSPLPSGSIGPSSPMITEPN